MTKDYESKKEDWYFIKMTTDYEVVGEDEITPFIEMTFTPRRVELRTIGSKTFQCQIINPNRGQFRTVAAALGITEPAK